MDIDWLYEAYRQTRKDGAAGIDGVTSSEYEQDLEGNLQRLLDRAQSGTYRVPPVHVFGLQQTSFALVRSTSWNTDDRSRIQSYSIHMSAHSLVSSPSQRVDVSARRMVGDPAGAILGVETDE